VCADVPGKMPGTAGKMPALPGKKPFPASAFVAVSLCLVVFAASRAVAQAAATPTLPPAAAIQELGPGLFRIGQVTLDKTRREVRFPATVNQCEGLIEYLLVGRKGKTHESLLRTDVRPFYLHTAMLLLGARTGGQPPGVPLPPAALDSAYLADAPLPSGIPVAISVRWEIPGQPPVTRNAETMITNTKTAAPMTPGSWIYNGSLFDHGQFMADEELSFAAVVTDPVALMNNPRPGHDNDEIWTVATDRVPPLETPVEVSITCLEHAR
jgi:hypothetical protein